VRNAPSALGSSGLDPDERIVMRFLKSRLSDMVNSRNAKLAA
jgi:hypothetical protein